MAKLPVVSGKKLLKILTRNGYIFLRQKGSHCIISSSDNRKFTVIPIHGNEDLGKGLFNKILDDLSLDIAEFLKLK